MKLDIAYLYPDHLNIYGDRGNILTLHRRCMWRGIEVTVTRIDLGENLDPDRYDLYFIGGGQDTQQIQVADDLQAVKAESLRRAVENGAVFLTICGGYQLLGHYYKPHNGPELRGLSLMDAYTVAGGTRFIGNVSVERRDSQTGRTYTVVGFENHSGLTYLGEGVEPLGKVISGNGNNGKDGTEGAVCGNLYGTYMHGSLLPKNPILADELITRALSRRQGNITLDPLPDVLETGAHDRAMSLKP
jgi:lipid II isoglutaminyl synthase (glutamine-hydrolysing)